MTLYKNILLVAFILAAVFAGCKDRWEEHIQVSDPALKGNVLEQISGNPNLSKFYGYLKETGYDATLASANSFTVWAPTNEALQSVDQDILNDPERLKQFVGNHITYQQYFTHNKMPDKSRIETLSGKYIFWGDAKSKVATNPEAGTLQGNIATSNGVVHLISSPFVPQMNSFEYLLNSEYGTNQAAFINSLQGFRFVDSLAPQIGVDPDTGEPIYDREAGMVPFNPFFHRGYDISNEDSLNTFIILTDEAFEAQVEKFRKYFLTGDADSTTYFTSLAVVKDLVFRGLYTRDELPAFLYSKDSVKVQINESDILHVERTSNGIVYVLDNLDISAKEKIQPIRIEGESVFFNNRLINPQQILSHPEKAGSVRMRERRNPITNELYNDLIATGHGIGGFNIRYNAKEAYSTTYEVYMNTYNDFNRGAEYNQTVGFQDSVAVKLPYATVPAGQYARIKVGEYTVEEFGDLPVFLVAAESSRSAENPLNLDFIELVPVIK